MEGIVRSGRTTDVLGRWTRQDSMHWKEARERERERSPWDSRVSGLSKWKEKVPFTQTGKIQKGQAWDGIQTRFLDVPSLRCLPDF